MRVCFPCAMGVLSFGVSGACLASGGAEPPAYHYHFFKEAVPLPLDTGRIAVFQEQPRPMAGVLVSAGLDPKTATLLPVRGWTVIDLPAGSGDADVRRIVGMLEADASFDFVSPVFIGQDGGPVIVTPDLMVGEVQGARGVIGRLAQLGHAPEHNWAGMAGVHRVRSDARNGFEVLGQANSLAALDEVRFAEPDVIFTGGSSLIPNDPRFAECWGIHNTGQSGGVPDRDMDGPEAWDITTGSSSIVVVIIDTGVDPAHPDLNLRLPGTDTTPEGGTGAPVNSCDNHGTPVAGCVSGIINNSLGGVGIAPGCRSASARTFISNLSCNGSWTSQASWTVATLEWARTIGARVTNNSNYYGFTSSAIAAMYADTRNEGIVHFASAGNNGSSTPSYPSSLPSVNAVAAMNRFGERALFSQYGVGLDFSAPGVQILTTDRTGVAGYNPSDYATVNGTSFASPYSAGVAALILSQDPSLSAVQVEERMQAGCVDLGAPGYDTDFGWGFVNARNSLRCPCDWDGSGTVSSQDFFSFLQDFFVLNGDYNHDGATTSQDFFDFLGCFLGGCA